MGPTCPVRQIVPLRPLFARSGRYRWRNGCLRRGKCTIGPAKATADCAYVPRAIGEVNVRNAQTGAPELVARIQTQKRARRAEVEWPTRYTKAKRSRGLMAGLPFGENAKFSCARLARASAPEREGAEGSIDASDRARAGDTVESQPAKIQARTVRRYCEKIK